jgi:Protein of unknown function (DUF4241)
MTDMTQPFSDLNQILQDGYSFKYELPNYGVQDVTISTHEIGDLILTSGKLLTWDLLMIPDARYFTKKSLEPGRYPVVLAAAHFYPKMDSRIACAVLRVTHETPITWEVAAIYEPDAHRREARFTYGVDSGTGSFMDVDVARIVAPWVWEESRERNKFEEFCSPVVTEMDKHTVGPRRGTDWANIKVSDDTEGNVITFSSGWGDGNYASFWGYDQSGNLASLVTDFDLFGA